LELIIEYRRVRGVADARADRAYPQVSEGIALRKNRRVESAAAYSAITTILP
jgi:hypothetical protein